jgi:isopropylmalate/homocitrate/citramalate synthase
MVHNAIKISGLIDFEFLKKLNKMHQSIENIFNLAVEETKKYYEESIFTTEEGSEDFQINKKLNVKYFCSKFNKKGEKS